MIATNGKDFAASESVHRTIRAMVDEAELQADLVADFLKANGVKPKRGKSGQDDALDGALSGSVANFLLHMGAALRLRQWERAAINMIVSPETPPAATMLITALNELRADVPDASQEFPKQIAYAALTKISRAAKEILRADIVNPAFDPAVLIERLADFLWRHRHLADESATTE